jgi:SRSO17 transposase
VLVVDETGFIKKCRHSVGMQRRRLTDSELSYSVCYVPPGTDLETRVRVAGSRWTVEEGFAAAKGEVGLDHYEVRSWHGWYRHMTLAMAALAYLAVLCAQAGDPSGVKKT